MKFTYTHITKKAVEKTTYTINKSNKIINIKEVICNGITKAGNNCKNKTKNSSGFCHLHNKKDQYE